MNKIRVEGMQRLHGEIEVQGSKNAVLPILAACVLNEGETVLFHCPKLKDVSSMLEALSYAGAKVSWEREGLLIDTSNIHPTALIENAGATRSSIILMGSFLARFGKIILGYPGGCSIGERPIDLHKQALEALGCVFREEEQYMEVSCDGLEGCDIYLPYPSVGVTENVLLAAAGASGMTRLYGAAKEPEIVELCRFLSVMGVRIYGTGTDTLFVMGRKIKSSVEYTICPDRIVAGTYLFAAMAAGGEIVLKNAPLEHMKSTIGILGQMGAELHRNRMDVKLVMERRPKGISFVNTAPYPGFPTDLQSPLLSVLCCANSGSVVEERMFENRFLIVEQLNKMGADIRLKDQRAMITPVETLYGAAVEVKELRGGAALVLAALEAEGESVITNAKIILRGYEDIVGDLQALGAKIQGIS